MITFEGKVCDIAPSSNSSGVEYCKKVELQATDDYQLFGNHSQSELAQVWGLAFTSVLFFYFSSLGVGKILGFFQSEVNRI